MIVTGITSFAKNRYKVDLDGQFAFVLYKGELSRFSIQVGKELEGEELERIRTEVLLKRAKARALHLLNAAPRTERELLHKLKDNLYPEDVALQALAYVKSFHYIDDYQYALNFIVSRREKKSKREIRMLLLKKEIDEETAEKALEEAYEEWEDQETILRLLQKKHFEDALGNPEKLHKIYAYLARKGFHYEDIRRVVQNYESNT